MIPHTLREGDRRILLAHNEHHFVLDPRDCDYHRDPDGTPNPDFLHTPYMTCTDPGCGAQFKTCFPVAGDQHAQRFHAWWRYATGRSVNLTSAAAYVNQEARKRGHHARLTPERFGTVVDTIPPPPGDA